MPEERDPLFENYRDPRDQSGDESSESRTGTESSDSGSGQDNVPDPNINGRQSQRQSFHPEFDPLANNSPGPSNVRSDNTSTSTTTTNPSSNLTFDQRSHKGGPVLPQGGTSVDPPNVNSQRNPPKIQQGNPPLILPPPIYSNPEGLLRLPGGPLHQPPAERDDSPQRTPAPSDPEVDPFGELGSGEDFLNPFKLGINKDHIEAPINYYDPASNPSKRYKTQLEADEHKVQQDTMTDLLAQLILSEDMDPRERDRVKKDAVEKLKEINKKKEETQKDIDSRRKIYNASQRIQRVRKQDVLVPKDVGGNIDNLNVKQVTGYVGVVDDSNSEEIRNLFTKLFLYGARQKKKFSHADYKVVLGGCLRGKLYEEFLFLEERPLQQTVDWFIRVYGKSSTYNDCEVDMKNFKRLSNESITTTMDRYFMAAVKADRYLPRNERYFTTEMHSLQVIERALQEPALSEYRLWRDEQLEYGFEFCVANCLEEAARLEKKFKAIPKHEVRVPVNVFEAYEPKSHSVNNLDSAIEANPIVKGNRPKHRANPYPAKNIVDPQKSFSPRANFYRDRNKARGQSNRGEQQGVGQTRLATPKAPNMNPNPGQGSNKSNPAYNNIGLKPSHFRTFSNPSGSNRGQYGGKRNRWSSRHDGNKGNQSINTSRQNSGTKRPRLQSSEYKPVKLSRRKGWFCYKCGVHDDMEKTKDIGSDHMTPDCRNYIQWSNNYCHICMARGLKANHWPKFCLNNVEAKHKTE